MRAPGVATDHRLTLWLLLFLAAAVYLVNLDSSTIWDANEAFYTETPREMIESGDYLSPSFNYEPRFNKPPLSYYVVLPFYRLFGVSEASERIPIALAALIVVACAGMLARLAFNRAVAFPLAALVLVTAPRFTLLARRILIDVLLAACMSVTLVGFALAELHPERRGRYLALVYCALGLGVLAKGPVAVALPALAILAYLVLARRPLRLSSFRPGMGALLVGAIVLPWYVAVYVRHGWDHIRSFLVTENVARFSQTFTGTEQRGPLFYLPVLLGDLAPWSLLLPAAAALVWRLRREGARAGGAAVVSRADVRLLMVVWFVTIVVFFSFSGTKQDLYILPIITAGAALVGGVLAVEATAARPAWLFRASLWGIEGLLVASGMLGLVLRTRFADVFALPGLVGIAAVLLAGGLFAVVLHLRARWLNSVFVIATALAAAQWILVFWGLPGFERYKPIKPMSEIIAARAGDEAIVAQYRLDLPSMVFYVRRHVEMLREPAQLTEAFGSRRPVFVAMHQRDYEQVRNVVPSDAQILARQPIVDYSLRALREGRARSEVLLFFVDGAGGRTAGAGAGEVRR
jgi:4-amino-4-deoxy-L-arabinose transferase-like glycosyltransferase